jgi:tRNA(Ile)-lysidine synthase
MVSGGSDSTAMARLMPRLYPTVPFTILHINHGLRGQDANADEAFVRALAQELALPFEAVHADVAAQAEQWHCCVEDAGRRVRYEAATALCDRLCAAAGAPREAGRIATAHTLDDRAETFIMRIIVGAGPSGLSSTPYTNGRVIRPLLACTRQQLRDWLQAQQPSAPWREDATNADTHYARAFVRHQVMPLLATRNPDLIHTLGRTIDVVAAESAYLDSQVHIYMDKFAAHLALDARVLAEPPVIASRVVREVCRQAYAELAPDARITQEHIEHIVREGARRGFALHIPGGVEVRNVAGMLTFAKARPPLKYHN